MRTCSAGSGLRLMRGTGRTQIAAFQLELESFAGSIETVIAISSSAISPPMQCRGPGPERKERETMTPLRLFGPEPIGQEFLGTLPDRRAGDG